MSPTLKPTPASAPAALCVVEWSFATANPIRAINRIKDQQVGTVQGELLRKALSRSSPPVHGMPGRVAAEWERSWGAPPTVVPVQHVFPAWSVPLQDGVVIPMEVTPAPDWDVSDVFAGMFGEEFGAPLVVLRALVERVAAKWLLLTGQVLPIWWRRPLRLRVPVLIHPRAIEGHSLEVPLLLALLRGVAMPVGRAWGDGPVFATGCLNADDSFGRVGREVEKLRAFLREFGDGHPAVLTEEQVKLLPEDLLKRVKVAVVASVADLLNHPELLPGLERLAGPPSPTELDGLVARIEMWEQSRRWSDADALADWLAADLRPPSYRFRVLRYRAAARLHDGLFVAARKNLDEAFGLIETHPGLLGAGPMAECAALRATCSIDSGEPGACLARLEQALVSVPALTPPQRAGLFGAVSQVLRAVGRHDDAVSAAERAVEQADAGWLAESGRDRNYLVHALLGRARKPANQGDLDRAERVLAESMGPYLPVATEAERLTHLGFCAHYEAEIARLRGTPHTPSTVPPWAGRWGHPRMFVLLACARNAGNRLEARTSYSQELIEVSAGFSRSDPNSIFGLLDALYRAWRAELLGNDSEAPCAEARAWCERLAAAGLPGWRDRLSGLLCPARLEDALDAIPYH